MYKIGDRVNRIEDREITGATIIDIYVSGTGEIMYKLKYDEGGEGWWNENGIKPE